MFATPKTFTTVSHVHVTLSSTQPVGVQPAFPNPEEILQGDFSGGYMISSGSSFGGYDTFEFQVPTKSRSRLMAWFNGNKANPIVNVERIVKCDCAIEPKPGVYQDPNNKDTPRQPVRLSVVAARTFGDEKGGEPAPASIVCQLFPVSEDFKNWALRIVSLAQTNSEIVTVHQEYSEFKPGEATSVTKTYYRDVMGVSLTDAGSSDPVAGVDLATITTPASIAVSA